jgi:bifunctional non-homologous end joining protein LigD
VPLDGEADFEEVGHFAYGVALVLVERDPEHLTLEFIKADRGARIFVDTGRNGYSATFAAPYAVRAKQGAPVSAPCTWEELERGEVAPRTFTLRNMDERMAAVGELWAGMGRHGRSLKGPLEKLRRLLPKGDWTVSFRRFG